MEISFGDVVSLINVIIWPVVVVSVVLVFRQELPKLVQALSSKISRLSVANVSLEFAAAEPDAETVQVLDEIREPSSTGPEPPTSGVDSLLGLTKTPTRADYLVIDLRDGMAWLTSRLYLFSVILPPVLGLRCFVFVGNYNSVPRYFLGLSSPDSISDALERRYPWLRSAKVEAQMTRPVVGEPPGQIGWWPSYSDKGEEAVKSFLQAGSEGKWNLGQAKALGAIVQSLVSPVDLLEPGQIEIFVKRFLENPNLRRPNDKTTPDEDWIQLGAVNEHADWIKNERKLVDLMGDDLRREQVFNNLASEDNDLEKAVLRKRGSFVAVTDPEGRFIRLIDRVGLLERVAISTR